jgi:hypothetical protein
MADAYDVLFDYVTRGSPNSTEHTERYLRRYPQFRAEIVELAALWRALSIIEALLPPAERDPVGDRPVYWRAAAQDHAERRRRARQRRSDLFPARVPLRPALFARAPGHQTSTPPCSGVAAANSKPVVE